MAGLHRPQRGRFTCPRGGALPLHIQLPGHPDFSDGGGGDDDDAGGGGELFGGDGDWDGGGGGASARASLPSL